MKYSTRFSFLRKPLKFILIVLLTVLLSTVALVFSLQAYLDGLVMDHAMNSTAYVGTVYSRMHKYPMIKELPNDIISMLENSESVDSVMISPTYSAKAEGLNRVADGFGNVEGMNMKQRVAIARCLAAHSPIIAADEPTGNLDEENAREVMRILTDLAHNHGKTVIIVTHDRVLAEQTDWQYRLEYGKLCTYRRQ